MKTTLSNSSPSRLCIYVAVALVGGLISGVIFWFSKLLLAGGQDIAELVRNSSGQERILMQLLGLIAFLT